MKVKQVIEMLQKQDPEAFLVMPPMKITTNQVTLEMRMDVCGVKPKNEHDLIELEFGIDPNAPCQYLH